jgi:cation diffusion facilitator family transporter
VSQDADQSPKRAPKVNDAAAPQQDLGEVMFVIRSSVWINFFLFVIKVYAFIVSGSLSVLASVVDSAIDLIGQGVLMCTKQLAEGDKHEDYPVGRAKLEPLGVMICAVVMGMASVEVIDTSVSRLVQYMDSTTIPDVQFDFSTAALIVFVVVLKGVLWVWCKRVCARNHDDEAVKAIGQDNLNDVFSNSVALVAAGITQIWKSAWMVDPGGAIFISIYIIYSWVITGVEQAEMLVGKKADDDFLESIQDLAMNHHPEMQLDTLRAYHFGPKYLVELEMVMSETTILRKSHDIGVSLQHKVEELDDVQRCFVHIDYQLREHDDHDPSVPLAEKLHGAKPGQQQAAERILLDP